MIDFKATFSRHPVLCKHLGEVWKKKDMAPRYPLTFAPLGAERDGKMRTSPRKNMNQGD
jgi:hypothetical protein